MSSPYYRTLISQHLTTGNLYDVTHEKYAIVLSHTQQYPDNGATQGILAKALQSQYLMKFRRYSSEETSEKILGLLTGDEQEAMMNTSDRWRAELEHKCQWDRVLASARNNG